MRKSVCAILAAVVAAALCHAGEAVVSNGCTVCILPGAYPNSPSAALLAPAEFPTNPAAGDLAVTNRVVVQYTVDGWQPVLRNRKFLIVRRVSGSGSVLVKDAAGDLVVLDDTLPSVAMWGAEVPQLPVWASATNGDAVVFYSQR